MSIKAKWAARASRYRSWADAAEAKANAVLSGRNRDWAFVSQPGRIPGRAADLEKSARAFALMAKAKAYRAKAGELERMASTCKGDAEGQRQAIRDGLDLAPGQAVVSVHYGRGEVVKVNAKSVRIKLASGMMMTQDKAYVRPV